MRRWTGSALQYAIGGLFVATGGYLFYYSFANFDAAATQASSAIPVFTIVEGQPGSADPYSPAVLDIPAGKPVALEITDNIGGCQLITVFPGLGTDGATILTRVPVGQRRRIVIRAPKPGRYRYHCSENMYFGEIVAR
ncbi:MAG: hypothetical protein EPN57_19940 [Paraburkholderia sp.]|nr:MAG: hypothetical protein EPN57_19940 [Paraburkholderia sp.]